MPDHTLAIVFRNPHPQRSPMRAKLYLLRRDGSNLHIDYPDQEGFHQGNRSRQADECGQQVLLPVRPGVLRARLMNPARRSAERTGSNRTNKEFTG